jgi:hypothetical protein
MTGRETNDERWLTEAEAADFLRRARQLDAGQSVRLRHVREAAVEAGLSVDAVNDAAEEMFEAGTDVTPPDWVRSCLIGVPNRTGAQFCYQLSCTAGLVSGAGAILLPSILAPAPFFAAREALQRSVRFRGYFVVLARRHRPVLAPRGA